MQDLPGSYLLDGAEEARSNSEDMSWNRTDA
jgi:hypothetical protein